MDNLHQFFTGLLLLLVTLLGGGDGVPEPATPSFNETAIVSRVIDGDTIDVFIEGREERVRYIGVDTPELDHRGDSDECYATEAEQYNSELVAGQSVTLVSDTEDRDKYDRLLRYVYVGDNFVNESLVRAGAGRAVYIKPDVAMYQILKKAEAEAKDQGRGLWSVCAQN